MMDEVFNLEYECVSVPDDKWHGIKPSQPMMENGQGQPEYIVCTIGVTLKLTVSIKSLSRYNFKGDCLNLTWHKSLKYCHFKKEKFIHAQNSRVN